MSETAVVSSTYQDWEECHSCGLRELRTHMANACFCVECHNRARPMVKGYEQWLRRVTPKTRLYTNVTRRDERNGTQKIEAGEADVVGVLRSFGIEVERSIKSGGWLNGRCVIPAHEDRNGSFGVNLSNGAFNCFGCGAKGNLADLIVACGVAHSTADVWNEIFPNGTS